MYIKLKQIKKRSLFMFTLATSLPLTASLMLFIAITDNEGFLGLEFLAFAIVSVIFSTIIAIFMTITTWVMSLMKPDMTAFKIDQNFSDLEGVFE